MKPPMILSIMSKLDKKEKGEEVDGLEAAAEDLIKAFHDNDPKEVAATLRNAFKILESEPHEEGPEEEETEE